MRVSSYSNVEEKYNTLIEAMRHQHQTIDRYIKRPAEEHISLLFRNIEWVHAGDFGYVEDAFGHLEF